MNSIEAFDAVVEGLEKATAVIARCAIVESLYLEHGHSEAQKALEKYLIKLYSAVLGFLCRAKDYYERSLMSMAPASNEHPYADNM